MKKKILVVEDEQMLAKIIGMKLEEEDYEVLHAYDGEEAYKLLIAPEVPDLVLLDVLLPGMGGFEVLEKLKAESKPLPKIIVFSNFAQKADVERARSLGAIDYIVKAAFSPAEILGKIKEVLEVTAVVPADASAPDGALATPADGNAYQSFQSLEDVMPMSEVLHPDQETNNP